MNDAVMVKLAVTGKFIDLNTHSHKHGRRGCFVLTPDLVQQAIDSGKTIYDSYCNRFAKLWRAGELLYMQLWWIQSDISDNVHGITQHVAVPVSIVQELVSAIEYGIHAKAKYLYRPDTRGAKIDASGAGATIRGLTIDKRKRRALSKAMRDCFRWPGETVHLYNDGADDFYFTTDSGYPSCGGLIHGEMLIRGHNSFRYSVHT